MKKQIPLRVQIEPIVLTNDTVKEILVETGVQRTEK